MAVRIKLSIPNEVNCFDFVADLDSDLKNGDIVEYEGQKYVVSNLPTNHFAYEDGVDLIETHFRGSKLL